MTLGCREQWEKPIVDTGQRRAAGSRLAIRQKVGEDWRIARPLHIELAGGLHDVTSRGDRREDIYLLEEDRADWLELVGEVCARFNWRCHACCQMT